MQHKDVITVFRLKQSLEVLKSTFVACGTFSFWTGFIFGSGFCYYKQNRKRRDLRLFHILCGFALASICFFKKKLHKRIFVNRTHFVFLHFHKDQLHSAAVDFSACHTQRIGLCGRIQIQYASQRLGIQLHSLLLFFFARLFFDEWFDRSNQTQKRITSVGYGCRNCQRLSLPTLLIPTENQSRCE